MSDPTRRTGNRLGIETRGSERWRAGRRLWEASDDALLRAIYPDTPNAAIAKQLRRSVHGIYGRAEKLGLHKSEAYLASPHACRLRRGDHVGRKFWYPKGHVPANKGARRPGWGPGRMKETQFRKGESRNKMPIGSTRLDADGYLLRKVSDVPHVLQNVNWKPEHRLLWIAAHGPIPDGHKLRFRDGDRTHVHLDNLELVSDAAMMKRNSVHNLPPELDKTIQLLGALNRQIRRRTHGSEEQDRRSA